jgi:hypothetical protein
MQFTLIAAAVALFATSAIADNCTPGLDYCGQTLLNKGKQPALAFENSTSRNHSFFHGTKLISF